MTSHNSDLSLFFFFFPLTIRKLLSAQVAEWESYRTEPQTTHCGYTHSTRKTPRPTLTCWHRTSWLAPWGSTWKRSENITESKQVRVWSELCMYLLAVQFCKPYVWPVGRFHCVVVSVLGNSVLLGHLLFHLLSLESWWKSLNYSEGTSIKRAFCRDMTVADCTAVGLCSKRSSGSQGRFLRKRDLGDSGKASL